MLWWTLQRLRSKDATARRRAAIKLYTRRDVRTVGPLLLALNDVSADVRTIAARALGEIGQPAAIGPLVAALKDWHAEVRLAAMEALVRLGGAAVEPLIAALTDQEILVRKSAAEVLGKLNDIRAIEALVGRLADDSSDVRRQVARSLEAMGWQPQSSVHRTLVAITTEAFEQVVAEGSAAVEPLIGALTVDEAKTRGQAAWALGQIGNAHAVEPLAATLRDPDDEVRLAVAEALVCFGDGRAVPPLVAVLTDVNAPTQRRVRAIQALGTLKDRRAIEPLLAALNDAHNVVREAAAKVLEESKDVQSVTPLLTALKVPDSPIGSQAAETLVKMGDVAVTPLMDALKDKDHRVRARAAETLAKIGQVALEPLLAALQDRRYEVRQGAAAALAKTGDRRAVAPLLATLWDDDGDVRKAAAEALEALGWYPGNATEQALHAMALQQWGRVASLGMVAIEPLLWALKDRRLNIRRGAAEVLAVLGWQPANVMHHVWFALALGKSKEVAALGKEAVLPLLMGLHTWDAVGRAQAAEVLGQLGDERAVEPMVALAGNIEVAAIAVRALERLLETCVARVAAEELQAIAALGEVLQMRRSARHYDEFLVLQEAPEVVDCTRIKLRARQELQRRGVEG